MNHNLIRTLILASGIGIGAMAAPAFAAPSAPPKTAPAKAEAAHVQGKIVSVSAKDHTITVESDAGGQQVLAVSKKATFVLDGKKISLASVKAGAKIDATMAKVKGKDLVEHAVISA